tara:strand:- start:697 stop:1512 length:816 start_codon:yes stop_codon:yes gene_type:complete
MTKEKIASRIIVKSKTTTWLKIKNDNQTQFKVNDWLKGVNYESYSIARDGRNKLLNKLPFETFKSHCGWEMNKSMKGNHESNCEECSSVKSSRSVKTIAGYKKTKDAEIPNEYNKYAAPVITKTSSRVTIPESPLTPAQYQIVKQMGADVLVPKRKDSPERVSKHIALSRMSDEFDNASDEMNRLDEITAENGGSRISIGQWEQILTIAETHVKKAKEQIKLLKEAEIEAARQKKEKEKLAGIAQIKEMTEAVAPFLEMIQELKQKYEVQE